MMLETRPDPKCVDCGETRRDRFYAHPNNPSGCQRRCKPCDNADRVARSPGTRRLKTREQEALLWLAERAIAWRNNPSRQNKAALGAAINGWQRTAKDGWQRTTQATEKVKP